MKAHKHTSPGGAPSINVRTVSSASCVSAIFVYVCGGLYDVKLNTIRRGRDLGSCPVSLGGWRLKSTPPCFVAGVWLCVTPFLGLTSLPFADFNESTSHFAIVFEEKEVLFIAILEAQTLLFPVLDAFTSKQLLSMVFQCPAAIIPP